MNLSFDIITRSCDTLTNRQRIRVYRDRLECWLENAPAEAVLIQAAAPEVKLPVTTNAIAQFLRKGASQ